MSPAASTSAACAAPSPRSAKPLAKMITPPAPAARISGSSFSVRSRFTPRNTASGAPGSSLIEVKAGRPPICAFVGWIGQMSPAKSKRSQVRITFSAQTAP